MMPHPDAASAASAPPLPDDEAGGAPPPRRPVEELRTRLPRLVVGFLDHGGAVLLNVDVGVGKSSAVLEALPGWLARHPGEQIAIATPTHALADELAAILEERHPRLPVRVWRGRDRPDPQAPAERMCRRNEEARMLRRLGLDAEALCETCAFAEFCGARRQMSAFARVWILPHQLLFKQRPRAMRDVTRLVVDEDLLPAALDRRFTLSADEVRGEVPGVDDAAMRRAGLALLIAALAAEDDRLHLTALREAGAGEPEMEAALRTARACAAPPQGVDALSSRDALHAAQRDHGLRIRAAWHLADFWEIVLTAARAGHETAPGMRLRRGAIGPQGTRLNMFDVQRRRELHEDWLSLPRLMLDATARPERIEALTGPLDAVHVLRAEQPHVRVRQATGFSFSAEALIPDRSRSPGRACRNGEDVVAYIRRRATEFAPGEVLVVAQKAVRIRLEPRMPGNVRLAHYNALRGLNAFETCRAAILVGRTLPSGRDVEMLAEALHRRPLQRPGDYVGGPAWRHPDPLAEIERRAICEAELVQAAGRGRGVNRTAEAPLQIDVLGPYGIGLEVDETLPWPVLAEDWIWACASRGAVIESARATDRLLAALLPNRFASAKAVSERRRYLRETFGHEPEATVAAGISRTLETGFGVSRWPRIPVRPTRGRYGAVLRLRPDLAAPEPRPGLRKVLGPGWTVR